MNTIIIKIIIMSLRSVSPSEDVIGDPKHNNSDMRFLGDNFYPKSLRSGIIFVPVSPLGLTGLQVRFLLLA